MIGAKAQNKSTSPSDASKRLVLLKSKQDVPVTMIVPKRPDLDPSGPLKEMPSAIRKTNGVNARILLMETCDS